MDKLEFERLNKDPAARRLLSPAKLQEYVSILQAMKEQTGIGQLTWSSPAEMALDLSQRLPGIPRWNPAKHLDLLNQWIMETYASPDEHLLISFPPRGGKTELTVFWNSLWYLHKHPDKHIMFLTHGDDTARQRGARVRNFITEHGHHLGIKLRTGSSDRSHWFLESGGSMRSVGTGGQIRGLPADLILADDLVKSAEQARSEVERTSIMNWWKGDVINRMEPGAKIICIGSRYHEADIMGRLESLSNKGLGMKFKSFKIPAIIETAEEEAVDMLGRKIGEVYWPERISKEMLMMIKAGTTGDPEFDDLDPFAWSAVFQQNPVPAEGAIINPDWWQWYDKRPDNLDEIIQSWDMTFKDTEKSDFVVGQVWGRRGAEYYLLDQVRERMNFPKTVDAVQRMKSLWPQTKRIIIEEAANGAAVIATLRSQIPGIMPEKTPSTGKEARLQAVSWAIEARNVYLPRKASWLEGFLQETRLFPASAHDDQVDALSQALKYLLQHGRTSTKRDWHDAIASTSDKYAHLDPYTRQLYETLNVAEKRTIRQHQRREVWFRPRRGGLGMR